jgi:hypothetical protein
MSSSLFGVVLAIFAVVWLSLAARGLARELNTDGPANWVVGLMGLLVIVGAAGFFATGLSAVGVLNFPRSFQWPAGYVSGVMRMPDGNVVVPLVPAGRLQLYDPQWRFLRGWQVNASGGDFRVECTPAGTIEVLTARGRRHYSFTESGDVISDVPSSDSGSDAFYAPHAEGQSVVVPTSPLLWVFSSPFFCWGVAAVGGVGIVVAKRLAHPKL